MQSIYTARTLFTGEDFLQDQAVVVSDGYISDILPADWLPGNLPVTAHSHLIIPSFTDAQIYGARGRLFSVYPDADTLQEMYAHCLEGGTTAFLPTIATNADHVLEAAFGAIKEYWNQGGEGVHGIHLEGPWINGLRRGAHLEEHVRCATPIGVAHLLEKGRGIIKMITLAPELCTPEILTMLREEDIVISAGHSNATFNEATHAFDNGVTTVTHLFNAMSPFHHRDTGLPGAAFMHKEVMASIIADGIHVDYNTLAVAKRLLGDRLFLITDAVTETDSGPYPHHFVENRYEANGILSGSALTMLGAVNNCIDHAGIAPGEAFRMAGMYPRRMLGIEEGLIEKERKASFLLLNEDRQLTRVVI